MADKFKIITTTLFVICTRAAIAGSMGAVDSSGPYDGFYVGANIGASNLLDDASWLINPEDHDLGSIGVVGGGFLGYDYSVTEGVKVGVEAFGNANGLNLSIQHYNAGTSYSVNSRYNLGLRVLPGYQFTPDTVWHLILGYANAEYSISDNLYGFLDKSYNINGFQTGLGLTSTVIGGLSIRLDAMYTTYASKSSTGFSNNYNASPYQYYTNDFSTLEGDLSLVYKFNL